MQVKPSPWAFFLEFFMKTAILVDGDFYLRREGINFVLDAMNHPIREDLQEHIDWLHTTLPKRQKNK